MDEPFESLARVPDHPRIETEVLAWWERERVFDKVRERNADGPVWSFIDGPITANNPAGVHHCWGRALKDVFQRYKALQGFHQRYQNGFDCQGLWVEVEVERSLGLNSKREIEEYGLAEFADRCKERVAEYSGVITEQSKRLGMWMDWERSYFTFSDTNIEYIWRFLKEVHSRGWLYQGHRAAQWCPRCGTALSHHEQIDSYKELTHPSLYVRFPLKDRPGEALVVWTTTPWTIPANVAAAVRPDQDYALLEGGDYVAAERVEELPFGGDVVRTVRGADLVGLEYETPFGDLPVQDGVRHTVIAWDDISLTEGTGIVHIAPGCGAEDFALGRTNDLPVLVPVDEAGRFVRGYGSLEGLGTDDVADRVVEELRARDRLREQTVITHRYPICWRCSTPLIFRVVDDWLISADEIRPHMLEANATVEWTPSFYSKRMDDWLRNMEDWSISRNRYFGLPLPFYKCESCGTLTVVGSLDELRERATQGLEGLRELHRPWIDDVLIRCDGCGRGDVKRIREVGDAWLDAGIVPFSTLGWGNAQWKERGYATGAAETLTDADLPDHAYWEQWFPAHLVSEMREQIRLWFYSISFMSVTLTGRSPYRRVLTYEKVRAEDGREMHKSWGNAIEANAALEKMGADVMRWMFAEQDPGQDLRFGFGPAEDVRRRLLTLWNSVSFFVTYANIEGFVPRYGDLAGGPRTSRPLDRWLVARVQDLVERAEDAFERMVLPEAAGVIESFLDDLSNWYIRRSRRRFYSFDEAAFATLWYALVQTLRVASPIMPFLTEHLWQNLVRGAVPEGAPESVFLAGWPEPVPSLRDEDLLAEVRETRRIVELGRQARGAAKIKLRQPLRRMLVQGARFARHLDEVREELRVKEVELTDIDAVQVEIKPNYPVLGPKAGGSIGDIAKALQRGEYERREDGSLTVAGHDLVPDDVVVRYSAPPGWALAQEPGLIVMLDTELDPELEREGRTLDLVHALNALRKERGLEVTDRVAVTIPESDADLLAAADFIKEQVLAVDLRAEGTELRVERAARPS